MNELCHFIAENFWYILIIICTFALSKRVGLSLLAFQLILGTHTWIYILGILSAILIPDRLFMNPKPPKPRPVNDPTDPDYK